MHDDEVLGKAYDSRLMRRLIGYLRPYRPQVAFAIATIIGNSALQLAPPYLTKVVIDQYIPARDLSGLTVIAALYLTTLVASFAFEYAQTWTMQVTGQRVMLDLRMQVFSHLQRLDLRFYDRNPVGRLMTRVTTDVDVLNELFTSGVVSIFGDAFTLAGIMVMLVWMDWRLALSRFPSFPSSRSSRNGSAATCAIPTVPCARGSRASTPTCRNASRACPRCSCSGARRATSRRSMRSTARIVTRTSSRSSTTRFFTPRSSSSARSRRR